MNVAILITVMSTLALALILDGAGAYNSDPCQRNYDNNAYNNFVRKHILQESFDRRSKSEWEGYIDRRGLCDRPYQTFIRSQDKRRVERICNGGGRQRSNNLCTSTTSIRVYDISVRPNDCKVTNIQTNRRYPVVACDNVANQCRPVHYERSDYNSPGTGRICQP
ncbi:uncharacterized protein ACNS7B_021053 [Menidia menidia]